MSTDKEADEIGSLNDHLDQLEIEDNVDSESQLIRRSAEESPENSEEDDTGKVSYYTGRTIYIARREFVLETDEPDIDIDKSVFLVNGNDGILRLDKLPCMINEFDLIRKHAIEIIRTTDPMSTERSIRFGYLSDQAIDLSELRERCYKAVEAAFIAADSACEDPSDLEDNTTSDEPGLNSETLAPEGRANAKDMPMEASYCCFIALTMAARCFAIETLYLDRAISNLDIAVLKMPSTPFKEFRQYLEKIRKEVQRLQVFFQRIEMEDDPSIDSVLCAICLELMPIIGFHDTEYPYHKMDFEWVCKKAVMRRRICTLFRDSAASMYPLFDMSWPEIQEMRYSNRSVGRRWFGDEEDSWLMSCGVKMELYGLSLLPAFLAPRSVSIAPMNCTVYQVGTPPPWKIIGTGTHVQHDITSPETWDMIRGWIEDCVDDHEDCRVVSEDKPFPTRIVAVGDEDTEPCLFIPSPEDRGRYIALSHCWGDAMPLKTTKASFAEFCHSIDFARFPKTFQESIIVYRKLKIEYLWIDSLCIIQDDEHDWAIESPKMCDVYQNAYLTIAAAAAHNSSEGLFHPRPSSLRKSFPTASKSDQLVEEVQIFARPWDSQWHWINSIGDGPWCREPNPLEKRAWAMQEHSGIVARCISASVAQAHTKRKESLRLINLEAMKSGKNPLHAPRILEPFIVWLDIIGPFTSRAITRDTD
ncbi:hypothetical protein LZL87_013431 [Fusarium oxysporum]|nr:hypothetical protein LZL87_013431 [Fusarium oxysporum]